MLKNFINHNEFRKKIISRFSDANENDHLITDEDKADYLRFLFYKSGKSYHVPQTTDIDDIVAKLKTFFEEEHKLTVEISELLDIKLMKILPKKGIAKLLKITRPMTLILNKDATYFSFHIIDPKWIDTPKINSKNEKNNFFNSILIDNIEKFIFEYLQKNNVDKKLLNFASDQNYFVENFNPKYQQFIIAERQDNEVLLSWLNVASVKNLGTNKDFYKKLTWFYILTNLESILIGFDKNGDILEAIDLRNRKLSVKKGIRNTIHVDEYEWLPSMSNSTKYAQISEITTQNQERRIEMIAEQNIANSKNSYKHYPFAKFLLTLTNNITAPLTTFLLEFIENKTETTKKYSENEKLNEILVNILNHSEAEEQLVFWYKDWKPNLEQSIFIIKMFIEATQTPQHLKKIFPIHSLINQLAHKEENDKLNIVLIDIEYIRHLIALDKLKEAEKIITEDLKKMPKQEIIDLLPPENINPTGNLSGQFINVILLSLLAKTQNKENADPITQQIATLQPLSITKIHKLTGVADNNLKIKANTILKILQGNGINPNFDEQKINIKKTTDRKDIELLKHPTIRKKGSMHSLLKWLSTQKTPDFSEIKKYAETFNPTKHKRIADIIADLHTFFDIGTIEIYIAHGEHAIGIRAYEGETSFLIIGNEHLIPDSPYHLTDSELRFALANETAYLYFKFARITSTDIWRGAMDKGNFVVNTLIDIIPLAGSVAAVAKNAGKIKAISNFFDKNEQITRFLIKAEKVVTAGNKSEGILSIASQMITSLRNNTKKDDNTKLEELIAVSRLMQITTDRIGILFNNDPASAVRAIFLSSKEIISNIPEINKYGLNSFLLKKNQQGNFINLNFAVRFAAMFSFWLSDEYNTLQKKLIENII